MPVVAEGVETEEQLALLRREQCDGIQGYLIGEPKPLGSFAADYAGAAPSRRAREAVAVGDLSPDLVLAQSGQ
jgi:sensor c-di-GMP phosphodiesterase-like protein